MKFDDLGLKQNENVNVVKCNGHDVHVKQYLPIEDKINLVQITLQQAMDNGIYNEGLILAYFNTYIIMYYNDIEFTDEQKQDVLSIFNVLDSSGFTDKVLEAIPKIELDDLTEMLESQRKDNTVYKQSAAYLIGQFIDALPSQMEKVSDIINNFDPSKYAEVINFATAANGGRNINTNEPMVPIES